MRMNTTTQWSVFVLHIKFACKCMTVDHHELPTLEQSKIAKLYECLILLTHTNKRRLPRLPPPQLPRKWRHGALHGLEHLVELAP